MLNRIPSAQEIRGGPVFHARAYGSLGSDATVNTATLQAAINAASTANGATVFVPNVGGVLTVTGLTLPPKVNLEGEAVGTSSGNGTTLELANGANTSVIASTVALGSTHHWSRISNLYIDGNKANNTSGHGIHVAGYTGEGFIVDHVFIANCAENGVNVAGGTVPLTLRDIHPFNNGGSGVKIKRGSGQTIAATLLETISGDDNTTALIELDNISGGPVVIVSAKSERHPNAVLINNCDFGKFVIIGLSGIASPASPKNALIRVQGTSTNAQVVWIGVNKDANISYIYDNNATGVQLATNASGITNTFGFDTTPVILDNLRIYGNLGVGNSAAATTLGTVTKKIEVFDASGTSLGFIPVYNSIS